MLQNVAGVSKTNQVLGNTKKLFMKFIDTSN